MNFSLRFSPDEIRNWASHYEYRSEARIESEIAPRTRSNGYYTRPDLLFICEWNVDADA